MASQIEMLERVIKSAERRLGADAPILPHLRTQLASLRAQRRGPRENPVTLRMRRRK
jgi:hypothetical protein